MQPISEIHVIHPNLIFWQGYDPQNRVDLSCAALVTSAGLALVDPLPLTKPALKELLEFGSVAAIFLTNGNHARAAVEYQQQTQAPIFAHEEAELECAVDRRAQEGAVLLEALQVIHLPGAGSGEMALWAPRARHLFIGDTLIHLEGFTFLPEKYCLDAKQARRSLWKLLDFPFETMTFAHGLPLLRQSAQRLRGLLEENGISPEKNG